jgi:TPR repeat protein
VDRDDKRAIELFKRGADQGHPLAMYNLAMHYRNGYGVRRSLSQAAEYFSKAADAGYVSAMVERGRALVLGEGISNPRAGMEWLQRAANQGSARAKLLLGIYYYWGVDDRSEGEEGVNAVPADLTASLLWLGRLADTRDIDALSVLAEIMQDGRGLASAQPEIAERYWRLAAYGGDATAQATFADRQRRGFALVKQEYGPKEPIILLKRAVKQGSAQAALALAQIYRSGEFDEKGKKNPVEALRYAYQAIELAVQNDKVVETRGEPFPEMGAAHLLSEMARKGEAVDPQKKDLLTPDQIDRLEHYYGAVDPKTGKVKIRRLAVKLTCQYGRRYDRRQRKIVPIVIDTRPGEIWVWDWGRPESPTEFQFRNLERRAPACRHNEVLRRTLIDIFEQAKKSKVSFADLVDQKVRTAKNQDALPVEKKERRGRRGRRWG